MEKNESIEEAAVRELWEETGLLATSQPIIIGLARAVRKNCAAVWVKANGKLRGSEEGEVFLVKPEELLMGPYGPWSSWAISAARSLKLLR